MEVDMRMDIEAIEAKAAPSSSPCPHQVGQYGAGGQAQL
jgi:hypothetical protein